GLGTSGQPPQFPLVGVFLRLSSYLGRDTTELEVRRQQLEQYRSTNEQTVADEIRQDVRTLQARARQVGLVQQRVTSLRGRVRELEARQARGLDSYADLTKARLDLLQAQGDGVKAVTDWHLALAKLKMDQGVLIQECGYTPAGGSSARKGKHHSSGGKSQEYVPGPGDEIILSFSSNR
ncbi:MAG: TolC family protein, partial [Planctomycetes bacterium]|nr:TolC family protein [Planctomycetota bacterium]